MSDQPHTSYDCVDPAVGDEIWQLDSPALDADLRRKLEAHVAVCGACRLDRELDARARTLVRDGEIDLEAAPPAAPRPSLAARAAGPTAALALAASLAGALILPPRPTGVGITFRGEEEPRFTRPVEGEVVPTDGCELSWTEVPGASSYRVSVSALADDFDWQGATAKTDIAMTGDVELTDGTAYKALLSTVPPDLLPPGRTSVAFAAGSRWRVAAHRLLHAQRWLYGLGAVGLALAGLALARRRG